VKTRMKSEDDRNIPVDIYILVEHKTEAKHKVLVQVLKYLYCEWQKDVDQKKPLRVIIPMIFYHGEGQWKVPRSFAGQFNVKKEIREFLLDYKYVLFDTGKWDFLADSHRELKDNVFLLTALVLMKGAYNDDMETVKAIFELWHERGFTENKEIMIFFLTYVSYIRDVSLEQLRKTLEECHLEGGDIMPSLAQRLIEQGREQGIAQGREQGREQGIAQGREQGRELGEKENAKEVARRMLSDDFPIATIAKYTGLTEQEVKELMN
jgi:predicted transposase/invertase (TIGR01784 family)